MFVGEKVHIVQILSIIFLCANGPLPPFGEGEGWVCLKLKQVVSAQQSLMLGCELRSDDSSECEALT